MSNPNATTLPFAAPATTDPATADALAALRPLVEPPPVPWWPPAPGWFVLAAVACLLIIGIGIFWWRRRRFLRQTRYRREALALLTAATAPSSPIEQLSHIAHVLRRAAVSVWGRESVAKASWEQLLTRHATGVMDTRSMNLLQQSLYSQHPPSAEDVLHLQQQATAWLQQLPPLREVATA